MLEDGESERAALTSALAIDQTDLLALIRLAELHERLGEHRPAAERWTAVLALSAGIADPSPEFAGILAHAKQYVGAQQACGRRLHRPFAGRPARRAGARDRRRMQRAADAWLGRRSIFTNHCEGLHYPFLPADEFFDAEHFPWLAELEAATPVILAELEAILADPDPGLTPYISLPPGVPASKWSGLDKSLDWGAFHLWQEGERFDAACDRAPRTAAVVESLPICRIPGPRAQRLLLDPQGRQPHSGAHRGDQRPQRRPLAADRPRVLRAARRRRNPRLGPWARPSPSTTPSSMKRGTAAAATARCSSSTPGTLTSARTSGR